MALKRHQSAPIKPTSPDLDPAGGTFAINPDFKLQQTIKGMFSDAGCSFERRMIMLNSHFLSAVAVRIRPLQTDSDSVSKSSVKKSKSDKPAWNVEKSGATDSLIQKGTARKVQGKTVFHFDSVFDEDTQTPLLYKSIARPMVKTVVCK